VTNAFDGFVIIGRNVFAVISHYRRKSESLTYRTLRWSFKLHCQQRTRCKLEQPI